MGFLDDLKRQAEALRARDDDQQRLQLHVVQAVDAAASALRAYLHELAQSLEAIRPAAHVRYLLDRQVVLQDLPRENFRFDSRRARVLDLDVVDHMHLGCQVRGGARVRLAKDFVTDIELLEGRLNQAGILGERDTVRHPDSGKLLEIVYDFEPEVQLSLSVRCRHEAGRLEFTLRNLDGLETVSCSLAPEAVTPWRLDELARWWTGEPHRFLEGAQDLRRVEAR